jgi:hypothetical protein
MKRPSLHWSGYKCCATSSYFSPRNFLGHPSEQSRHAAMSRIYISYFLIYLLALVLSPKQKMPATSCWPEIPDQELVSRLIYEEKETIYPWGRCKQQRVVSKSDFGRHIPGAQIVGIEGYTCNHTAHFSSCCFGDDSCVEGGLCFGNLGFMYRRSCTDPAFQDSSCLYACIGCEWTKVQRWEHRGI